MFASSASFFLYKLKYRPSNNTHQLTIAQINNNAIRNNALVSGIQRNIDILRASKIKLEDILRNLLLKVLQHLID